MKKNKIILIFLVLIIGMGMGIYHYKANETYTYEWVEVEDSAIGQYKLYINNSKGKHVDGTARLVYINGKTKRVEVDEKGLLYIKEIVKEVRNPKGR